MSASFDSLPPEIRLMIYRYLFAGKTIHYLGAGKDHQYSSNQKMPSMLGVSKLHHAEAADALAFHSIIYFSKVTTMRPVMGSRFKFLVRSLHIRLTHKKIKLKSLELPLSQMMALSEVTISEELSNWFLRDRRLSRFKQQLQWAQNDHIGLGSLPLAQDPRRSIYMAFQRDPWCQHVLQGRSALHNRPHVKLFAEVERRLWSDIPERAAPKNFLGRIRDFLFRPQTQQPAARWVPLPGGGMILDAGANAKFVNVIGRMSLVDWVMRWEVDGEEFAIPQQELL